jgi:hypothetical protein
MTWFTDIWAQRLIITSRFPRCGINDSPMVFICLFLPPHLRALRTSLPVVLYDSKNAKLNSGGLYGKRFRTRVSWCRRCLVICDQHARYFSSTNCTHYALENTCATSSVTGIFGPGKMVLKYMNLYW